MRLAIHFFLSLLLMLVFSTCTVGPNYKAPENTVEDTWNQEDKSFSITKENIQIKWWKAFKDPLLNKYIAMGIKNNNDILTAMCNILQARALRKVAASSFFPKIGADVNATKTYFSKNGPVFDIGAGQGDVSDTEGLPFILQVPQIQSLYNILFDASWEIDIFGKTRRTVEAADAIIGRTIEEKNDTLISVIAEIARNYMELRAFQEKSQLIEENIDLLKKKSCIVCKQFTSGFTNRLDEEDILATLYEERSKLPGIQAEIYKKIYTLSILLGNVPESLVQELLSPKPLPIAPEAIAIGLRSDLLRRRPDVRRSERDLAAATANIGVAVASFFPTFTLLGGGGLQSLTVKNLFSLGSRTWALGGDINMPIFEGGRLIGNLYAKRAETAAKAHVYQQTVLKALQETESAIASYTHDLETVREKKCATNRYENLVFLSTQRHGKGLINYLDLLDRKKDLNAANQDLLDSNITTLIDLISLYKALGGGWQTTCSKK